jgi:putative peptide zinc metalloprotease protein
MTEPARPRTPARQAPGLTRQSRGTLVPGQKLDDASIDVDPGPAESSGAELPSHPTRANGLALLGEFAGSGLARPVFLARRADGQVVALTELLARVLEAADGSRDVAAIAGHVGERCARQVSGADIAYLLAHRLMPLGLIAASNGVTPAPRARSLLQLTGRRTLLPASVVYRISGAFAVLFRPAAMAVLLGGLVAGDVWLFGRHSARDSAAAVLATPSMILVLVGVTLVSALFHECGHAAACRYGGARPGVIGVGMYLVWPAFFTDVTDSYRLRRWGRLRTDLGGIYFNGIFALLVVGAFAVTRAEVLVTAAVLVHLDAFRQLAPFVRLDGYYIVSDLVGVPDLFDRMGPAVRSALRAVALAIPFRRRTRPEAGPTQDPRMAGLTRRAQLMVTAWALCAAPVIVMNLVMLVVYAPFVLPRTASAVRGEFGQASRALASGDLISALAGAVSTLLVAMPAAGMLYLLIRLGRRVVGVAVALLSRLRLAGGSAIPNDDLAAGAAGAALPRE